jgi:hypothetical protein
MFCTWERGISEFRSGVLFEDKRKVFIIGVKGKTSLPFSCAINAKECYVTGCGAYDQSNMLLLADN